MKILIVKKICSAILLTFSISHLTFAEVAIIVNPASGVSSLTGSEAKRIFLAKNKKLPNGKKAVLMEQADGSAVRDEFNRKILKKSGSQYQAYWSKIVFSGKGSPPKSGANDAAVKAFVAGNVNAIGYIGSGAVDSSVKVVLSVK